METYNKKITPLQADLVKSIPTELSTQEDYQNAEFIAEQTVNKQIDFNLKQDVDTSLGKSIVNTLHNAEEERKAEEKMAQWKLQLSSVESKTEQIMIAMEFEIDVLIEALKRNVEEVDDTYLMFCKKEDRKPMHTDAINKIMEDMKSEHDEIVPYIQRSKKYETKMM